MIKYSCKKCNKQFEDYKSTNRASYCKDCSNKKYDFYKARNRKSYYWAKYRYGARKRNLEWNITKDFFESMWNSNCYYCGDKIKRIGIDRLDNKKGYTPKNVVPCCTFCNRMKNDHNYKDFIKKCKKIASRN